MLGDTCRLPGHADLRQTETDTDPSGEHQRRMGPTQTPKWLKEPRMKRNSPARFRGVSEVLESGALGRIRTPDPLVRSQVLYPAELRARGFNYTLENFFISISFFTDI